MPLPSRAVTVPGTLAAQTSVALTSRVPRVMVVFLMIGRYMGLSSTTREFCVLFLSALLDRLPLPGRRLSCVPVAQREEQKRCHSGDGRTPGFLPCLR